MKHRMERLQRDIRKTRDFLEGERLFSMNPEQQEALREEVGKLSLRVEAVEGEWLTIGLLGGTGVGKSTLMNALAGEEIASTSHRRPYTDRVLIYRHAESAPLSLPALEDVPWQEITHRGRAIEHLLLCDLPDFDSLMGDHRRHVLRFLEDLDLLVWVASPEKYGDGLFYDFLDLVPKAEQNFVFVLNKGDILFRGEETETGYHRMESVAADFRKHIAKKGIGEPLLYILSADEAAGNASLSPWNQFPAFKQYLFQQRTVKQIAAVKTANLDVEVGRLLHSLDREISVLNRFEAFLDRSLEELEAERPLWIQAGGEVIDLWIRKWIKKVIPSFQDDPSRLVGPAYTFALIYGAFQRRRTEERDAPAGSSVFDPPREVALSFQRRMTWVEDRFDHRMLRQDLPAVFQERIRETLNAAKRLEDLQGRLSSLVGSHVSRPSLPPFRAFRVLQYLVYLLLLVLFLFAVGGIMPWKRFLEDPGARNLLILMVSGVQTLFSGKGLAALGSFALLNAFFGLRFHRLYRRLVDRAAGKTESALRQALLKIWEECLDAIAEDLNRLNEEIRGKISALSSLGRGDERH